MGHTRNIEDVRAQLLAGHGAGCRAFNSDGGCGGGTPTSFRDLAKVLGIQAHRSSQFRETPVGLCVASNVHA